MDQRRCVILGRMNHRIRWPLRTHIVLQSVNVENPWVKAVSALPPRNMFSWPVKPFQRHRDKEEKVERHPQNCHIFTYGMEFNTYMLRKLGRLSLQPMSAARILRFMGEERI